MLTWLNTKHLNVHLVTLLYVSFKALAHCRLSKNIVGITWCVNILFLDRLLNLQVKLYYAFYLRPDRQ